MRFPDIDPAVLEICRAVRAAGGRALLVGGGVRDRLLGLPTLDDDLEVYGLDPDALAALLRRCGTLNTVGARFTVHKLSLARADGSQGVLDVSIPRRDSKIGVGHRGFEVTGDPFMSFAEATRRRDFTINAILYDPLGDELIDPQGGVRDTERRLLRAVDPATFVEDSLRVLRGLQFVARFELAIDPETAALCRGIPLSDLPGDRIRGEFEKLLLLARHPSCGLQAALELGVIERLLPDLRPLVGCPQDPRWHPEGDVFVHTLLALDEAAGLTGGLARAQRFTVMLAVLLHDIGKPAQTRFERGHLRSPGHEESARAPALRVLDTLNVHTLEGYDVRTQVVALVTNHLKPLQFYQDRDRVGDGAFRRLALRCDLELLYLVAKSDALARGPASECAAQDWFIERARALALERGPPRPLLQGRHLIELGMAPGPRMGEVLRAVYERQLDGEVKTLGEARAAARELLAQPG